MKNGLGGKRGFFSFPKREKGEKGASGDIVSGNVRLILDLLAIAVGFLFGGCHTFFGAYPLGIALVAALPKGVVFALIGAAVGSLTLGRSGIIYAMICVLVVFLRVVVSGGRQRAARGASGEGSGLSQSLFSESILLRSASALLGGLISAVYELLLAGFSLTSLVTALAMTVLPPLITPLLTGIFDGGVTLPELIFGGGGVFSGRSLSNKERFDLLFFKLSALTYVFLISVCLKKYVIFGIDLAYIFAAVLTLLVAKRFGALYAMTVGFFGSVGISPLYSVSFALLGLASGAVFPFGAIYALLAGGAALSLFAVYAGELTGLLSVLPELLIGSVFCYPTFRHLECERRGAADDESKQAADMVGTMALSYRLRMRYSSEAMESACAELSRLLADSFGEGVSVLPEDIAMLSRLIGEAKEASLEAREIDEDKTSAAEEVFRDMGFRSGVIRVFGGREKYVICAAEDKEGIRITSREFKAGLEGAIGCRLAAPRFYRRGSMALMEASSSPGIEVRAASAAIAGSGGEVSGDTVTLFETEGGIYNALVCDGMGSGEEARRISRFVSDFFLAMKDTGARLESLVYMLNGLIKRAGGECSAALDLFSFDRITAEAKFYKAGAAASYIKRGGSLFRIKSETLPIGVLGRVDAERIAAEVGSGDSVIMLSDGVGGADEDAPWLIEYLKRPVTDPKVFAEGLVSEAKRNNPEPRDDISVAVVCFE